MKLPRILLTAGKSGSGKTLLTCGLLKALLERGMKAVSCKCGPDFIDPMFHSAVIGTPSRNLDTFFTSGEVTRYLLCRHARENGAQIAVLEGAMGYYDGLGGISEQASAYEIAKATDTPAVLIVDCQGMSVSILPYIQGFLSYRADSRIQGAILNRFPAMLYPQMKKKIESELGIRVFGYVPKTEILDLKSRHLGLVTPEEIPALQEGLLQLAQLLEQSVDVDALLALAQTAPEIEGLGPEVQKAEGSPVIAVAKDEAFCFLYEDNLALLRECGAKLKLFSPLHEERLPKADGLLLPGGYPELFLPKLSGNAAMRASIAEAVRGGLPCMAECGGFMYLQESMEDMEGKAYPMAGAIPGKAFFTGKLGRFGYITLDPDPDKEQMLGADIGQIRAHEFHYYDSSCCGDAFHARKPLRARSWDCIQAGGSMLAGYPHLYYYSNPRVAERFVRRCAEYKAGAALLPRCQKDAGGQID